MIKRKQLTKVLTLGIACSSLMVLTGCDKNQKTQKSSKHISIKVDKAAATKTAAAKATVEENTVSKIKLFRSSDSKLTNEPTYIWWEAEDALSHTFPESNSFKAYSKQEKSKLSGGTWLQTDKGSSVKATWEVEVPKDGTYNFWTRKFWTHGPFKWRFNDQAEKTCTRKCGLVETVQIRRFVCADWVSLGEVTLKKGKNKLHIEALKEATAIAFDCWVLTDDNFIPKGPKKPGTKYNKSEPGWFAFEPDNDKYTDQAMFDMREFNQKYAGIDGYVKAQGKDFVFEKTGEKVKFWAVNAIIPPTKTAIDELAIQLSKRGVNMARVHSPFHSTKTLKLNKNYWDRVHYFINRLSQEGIYTKLSFYFPLWYKTNSNWKISGYDSNKTPYGLLFFQPQMQNIYKRWVKEILTTKNPYSGKAIKDDPAVAIIEIMNEDGLFFWTFSPYKGTPKEAMAILEKLFGDWLKEKYGTLAKAKKTWGAHKMPKIKDEINKGRMAIYQNMGLMGNFPWAKAQRNDKRIFDQVQFLVELQRSFYEDMSDYYKKEMGYKGLLSASNWHTVDDTTLGALENYTYTATDIIDRHGYLGGKHKSEKGTHSYSVRVGDTFENKAFLKNPDTLTKEILYGEQPQIISEYNYPTPNRFRAEGPFMIATYGSLAGTDAFFYFRVHTAKWANGNGKFPVHTPSVMGQFPAFSHIYRKGYVKEGPKVVNIDLSLKDLYQLKGTPASQPQHLDALRAKDIPAGGIVKAEKADSIDPYSYYVGQVQFNFTKDKNKSEVKELSKYIDRDKKTIKSATDQLLWDWGKGVATFNAPEAQGATGFLKDAGSIKLDDVVITGGNEYQTIAVVALDDKPIKESSRILVQVMTEDKNCGAKSKGDVEKTIVSRGEPPIIVKEIKGDIKIKHSDSKAMKIFALDANGYKKEELKSTTPRSVGIKLQKDVIYYIVTK